MFIKRRLVVLFAILAGAAGTPFPYLSAQEVYVHRPDLEKKPVSREGRITLHGEYFGYYLNPGDFPGFNDLSGPEDRWLYGFQNIIHWSRGTRFLAQLLTHDDGGRRTKFDWHFSLRQNLLENLVLIIGHDSNHDSDNRSTLANHSYYLNRNYVGIGLPFSAAGIYIEPFTWFFHHTNQRSHLDYSGEKLKQEYGIRIGGAPHEKITVSFQVIAQSDTIFAVGQSCLGDLLLRLKAVDFLELSAGFRFWKDIGESRLGGNSNYRQLQWGIALVF